MGHALHLLHPIFRCYTYSDRVKSVCLQLGFNEPAVVQSMYIYKNPGVGSEGNVQPPVTTINNATEYLTPFCLLQTMYMIILKQYLKFLFDIPTQRYKWVKLAVVRYSFSFYKNFSVLINSTPEESPFW